MMKQSIKIECVPPKPSFKEWRRARNEDFAIRLEEAVKPTDDLFDKLCDFWVWEKLIPKKIGNKWEWRII